MSFAFISLFTNPQNSLRCRSGFIRLLANKNAIGETVVQLDNTLLGRIMSYLDTKTNKLEGNVLTDDGINMINNLVHGKSSYLRKLSVDQLAGLFYSANSNLLSHTKQNMVKVLSLLDIECCLRINNMDSDSILKVLNAYMHVIPNRITEYKFYQYATDNFDRCLNHATYKELLQIIFYIGLQKNSKKSQFILKKCLRKIDKAMLDSLTVEDLCIICNSTYRTHCKITNKKILDKIKEMLNNNLYILKDPALLITLIKTIKHNRCQDDDILSTIKYTIFFNRTEQYYTFPAMCHILALYADDLYYEEHLLKLLIDKCIKDLQNTDDLATKTTTRYLVERPKDITRFLWILATLGYKDTDQDLFKNVIIPNIQKQINAGLYNTHPEELTDAILYLRMLNYHAKELMDFALSPKHISHIKGTRSKHRLDLLLTIIKYQDDQLFKRLNLKQLELSNYYQNLQIQIRTDLQRVLQALNSISHDLNVDTFQINMQIPHLNIVGISAYKELSGDTRPKIVANIEVLDDTNCVKNKDCWPTGYMKLKLQILELLPVPFIMISKSDIDTLTEDELKTFLKEEFQLIFY